jgi:hypothetical protein
MSEYIAGFDNGCDYLIHEIQKYLLTLPHHEAMVLVRLLGYLQPPTPAEIKHPH